MNHDTMLSRAAGTGGEKLTIIAPLTIRQTESLAKDIQGLADLRGMEKSEYIRHLVEEDKKAQHRIWLARNQLFSGECGSATDTAHDVGIRE
jgi:hypothetical protein